MNEVLLLKSETTLSAQMKSHSLQHSKLEPIIASLDMNIISRQRLTCRFAPRVTKEFVVSQTLEES